jgi:hypothetical protein
MAPFHRARPGLVDDAEDDAAADPSAAAGERNGARQRAEQRRLAAPVAADDRDAVTPAHLEVERAEPELRARHDGAVERHDKLAGSLCGRELQPQLSRLPRLLDQLESLQGPFRPADLSREGARATPVGAAASLRERCAGARVCLTGAQERGARTCARSAA